MSNPLTLLSTPEVSKSLTECIRHIGWTLSIFLTFRMTKKRSAGEFPFDVFENAITDFRKNEMKVSYRPYKCDIEGTSLTSVFTAEDSPGEAVIWVTFKKGRTELFQKHIATQRAGLGGHAFGLYPEVIPTENALEIHGIELSGVIRIPYSDLPSQLIDHIPLEAKKS